MNEQERLFSARMASVRYATLAVLTFVAGWLKTVGISPLSDILWQDWASLVIGSASAGLVALGGTLNTAWADVKNGKQP